VTGNRKSLLVLGGVAVAAIVAVVVAVTAMGGDKTATKPEYQATIVSTRDRVDFAYAQITKADSVENLVVRLDAASAAVKDVAGDLRDAGVAPGFEGLNENLAGRLDAFSASMAATADQFDDPSSAGFGLDSITSLGFGEWDEINAILTKMRKKGLEIELLERH
jgi:hypothetical protein